MPFVTSGRPPKSTASGSGVDPVGLKNSSGVTINPATEDKQDAIITAIGAIPGGGGVQYEEGDNIATTPTGTLSMVRDGSNQAEPLVQPLTDTQLRASAVPISASSLPLPTGASTLAEQQTQTTHLASIAGEDFATQTTLADVETNTDNLALLHVSDYDTGAGTDNTPAIGLVIPSNSGASPISTTNPLPTKLYLDGAEAAVNAGNSNGNTLRVVIATDQAVLPISDNGGSLTVDGTVAATQSGTWDITNISGTVSLPTGASTSANQSTIIGHLDGVEGLLTTIDADTSTMNTNLATLAGAVAGTEVQVDVVSIPTVTVQATNLDIRDLSQSSDAVAVYGSDDGGTTKRIIKTDASGTLDVNIVSGAGSGGTASTDDADFTAGSTSGTPAMGVYESTPTTVTDGDLGIVGITSNRQLKVSDSAVEALLTTIESNQLPDGHNVTIDNASIAVTGTFWQATQPISAASLPLPTGASTSANQSTIIGHLDGVEGLLTTIDADTSNISTKIDTLAGAVAGTEMQVDVVTSALPTGASTAANQTTIIGHVDGIETLLGTIDADTSTLAGAVSGTEMQVDIVASLPAGTNYIGKFRPTDGTTDAEVVPLAGYNAQAVAIVDGSGNQITSFGGGTQYAVDGALGSTPTGTLTIFKRDDALASLTPVEGDAVEGRVNARGAIWMAIEDGSGNQITSFGGGTQYTEGDTDASITGTAIMWEDTSDTLRAVSASKPLPVNITNTGVAVAGDVAHDGADSGNPIKVGHKAIAHGTNPTAVAAGDRTDWYANRAGVPFVMAGHPNIVTLEASYTAAQTNTAIVTVAGGLKIVVTQIQVINDAFSPNVVDFRVGFAASTTPTTTGVVATHPAMIPGAFYTRGDGSGILGIGADGEDLRITSADPGTSGEVRVLVSYYTIES